MFHSTDAGALSPAPGFENSTPPRVSEISTWPNEEFKANYNFPTTIADQSYQPWMILDPRKSSDRGAYYSAILDYGLQAMNGDITNGCQSTSDNWFHAPWMTRGESGREPLCGLTKERKTRSGFVYPILTDERQAWAIGFYNNTGAYQFGEVWKDKEKPDLTKLNFQNGTFVIKFLFVDVNENDEVYKANLL